MTDLAAFCLGIVVVVTLSALAFWEYWPRGIEV